MDKFIAGSGGGGKGGGGGSRTPSTDPDSLNSRSFGHIVDLISEGEIAGLVDDGFVNPISGATDAWMRSIFLDNTPLKNADGTVNFDDVIVRVEHGTANQPVLPGFEKASNIINNTQSGVEIDATGQQFNITDASTDQVLFLLSVPQLQKIKNNGDTEGTEFKFKFQKSTNNGAFQDFSINGTVDQTIKGRTADLYQKQYVFDISTDTFPVRFKVIRTSVSDTAFMNDNDGFISHVSKFYVTSHTLIKHQASDLSGTYTHNNGSGGAGKIITITSSTDHLLEVGDSIGCEFNNSTNTSMVVNTVVSPTVIKAEHTEDANVTGTVTFGQRFNYPNSAVIGLRIDAEQFNSVPKRSYLIKGIKVKIPNGVTVDPDNGRIIYPSNYVFNGTLGAAQWTTDPAWCLFDLLTSQRYGCGDFISASQLDIYSFYAASVYSSELVTFKDRLGSGVVTTITEPRFSLNVNIQTRQDVFKTVNSLCSVFRAMPLYVSGSISLIQDKAGIDPSFLFTNANVTRDGFSYSGSGGKTRATVVVVKYFDIELRDAAYEQVIDNDAVLKYGAVTKTIDSFGVTSRHQARRLAKWFLTTLATETDIVSFSTTIQAGSLITPGQIIEIQDPVKSGVRRGGQITSVETVNNNSVIGIDNIVDLPVLTGGLGGMLSVILPDGQISKKTITTIDTTNKKITVVNRFEKKVNDSSGNKPFLDNTRQTNPVYTDTFQNTDPNVGSFWIIETTGTSAAIQSQLYKVVSVEESDDFTYGVTAVLHNESKYAAVEALETIKHRDVTNLDLIPASPSDWASDTEILSDGTVSPVTGGFTYPIEQLYKYRTQVKVRVLLAWKPVSGVNRYELRYQKDSSGFQTVQVQNPSFTIDDIAVSSSSGKSFFDFEVRSISASGKKSSSPLTKTAFEVVGKNAKPSQVNSDFAASLDPNLGVVLSWTAIAPQHPNFADLDIRGYIIYEGTYGSGTLLGEYKATSVVVPTLPASSDANKTYSIKAVDDDGNESELARTTTITFNNPNAPTSLTGSYQDDNYILNWNASVINGNRFAIAEYEIRQGTTVIATTSSLTFTLPVTWSSDQTFKVRARDITGKESTDTTLTAVFAKAAAPNISYSYEGSKIRLTWTKPTEGSTKIKDYVIKASETNNTDFGAATAVDVINSESYLLDVDHTVLNTSKARRFFVAARDANSTDEADTLGNIGRTGITNYPDVSVSPSPAPNNLTAVIKGASAFVSWDEVSLPTVSGKVNGLPIAFYKIYRENAGATSVGTADFQQNGTSVTEEVTWTDATQRYFVRAVDVNGNDGNLQDVDFTVAVPSAVTNLSDEVIDNNVLLRWTESAIGVDQLPIKHYNVYRNNLSTLVGQKLGTFTTVFEQVGGQFEYILKPVNTAGNEGTQNSVVAEVNQPPDFVLTQDFASTFNGTIVNGFTDAGGLFFCINTSRTWKQHFDPNNNDTSRTFGVYGGSTVYALPSENSGSYEEVIDTGATIDSTRIEASIGLVAAETIGSGLTITPHIFTSPDNVTYTSKGSGNANVIGTNFRYIKIQYSFAGANNDDLIKVNSIRVKTFLKRKTDQGRVDVTASESQGSGKQVTFAETFLDVDSIQLTIQGTPSNTNAKYAIYDFLDTANPQNGFKVFLFDDSGNGVAGTVDFTVRGV